jgi:hypothetical protein
VDVAAVARDRRFLGIDTVKSTTTENGHAPTATEEKKAALSYLHEAWTEARLDGLDDDCMAQACLFAAFADMVSTYGEEAAAKYAENLPARILRGDFSVELVRQ